MFQICRITLTVYELLKIINVHTVKILSDYRAILIKKKKKNESPQTISGFSRDRYHRYRSSVILLRIFGVSFDCVLSRASSNLALPLFRWKNVFNGRAWECWRTRKVKKAVPFTRVRRLIVRPNVGLLRIHKWFCHSSSNTRPSFGNPTRTRLSDRSNVA